MQLKSGGMSKPKTCATCLALSLARSVLHIKRVGRPLEYSFISEPYCTLLLLPVAAWMTGMKAVRDEPCRHATIGEVEHAIQNRKYRYLQMFQIFMSYPCAILVARQFQLGAAVLALVSFRRRIRRSCISVKSATRSWLITLPLCNCY